MNDKLVSRRKFPRVGMRYEFCVSDEEGEFSVTGVDFSFGGAFVETDRQLPVGKVLNLVLKKDGSEVGTDARIVHRHRLGYGVSFIEPSDEFYDRLTEILFDHVVTNVRLGAPEDTVPARIAVLCDYPEGHRVLFSTHMSPKEVWLITEEPRQINEKFWITVCEHGMFDCEVRVAWCGSSAMGIEFVDPSVEFSQAYDRVFDSFLAR